MRKGQHQVRHVRQLGVKRFPAGRGRTLKPRTDSEGYSGWTNWDTWETWLILTNTQSSYNWLIEWSKNFKRKYRRNVFDMKKAESVVVKYLIPAARGGYQSKRFNSPYESFVGDPNIDPKKVNKREIVYALLDMEY